MVYRKIWREELPGEHKMSFVVGASVVPGVLLFAVILLLVGSLALGSQE